MNDAAIVALGISVDEYQRMRSHSGIPHETLTYPLIDRRIDRAACIGIIERVGPARAAEVELLVLPVSLARGVEAATPRRTGVV